MTSLMDKFDAAGILVTFNGLVLLGRRSKFCNNLTGYWSMPCGAIERGESPRAAATREFFEETGVLIKKTLPLTSFTMKNNGNFTVFHAELNDLIFPTEKAKDAFEHDEWGFFKIEKNCLPNPISKETKNAILKLK